ncbi:MAG: OmpA family protein [Myxococcota bacterium]
MKTATLTLLIALAAPTVASASPVVWSQVPEYRINNVDDYEARTELEQAEVDDHEYAVMRREIAVDDARDGVHDARDARGQARKNARHARKELRRAKRHDLDVFAFTTQRNEAERDLLEARDYVDLAKARVGARKAHLHLEEARLGRAIAQRELREARLLEVEDAHGTFWHRPPRYERQLSRWTDRAIDRESDWRTARVDVRETRQDYLASFQAPLIVPVVYIHPAEVGQPADVALTRPDADTPEDHELRRVHFALESAELDTDALNNLAWDAHVLRENRDVTIRIEGHTDATGTEAFNRELAWDRAENVAAYLMEQGVWESQIETAGYGETGLKLDTQDASVVNRRAELRVIEDGNGLVDGTVDDADDFGDQDS